MYRELQNPLQPELGRMVVDKSSPNMGPPLVDDTVTIGVSENVDFYIRIHWVEGEIIRGEIVAIGPSPQEKYKGWTRGDYIQINKQYVRAIIRSD